MKHLRLWLLLAALAGLVLLIWGFAEGWLLRALGGLFMLAFGTVGAIAQNTAGAAGKAVNDAAKAVGAREVKQKPGPKVPRHDGLNTHEPHSVKGEKPRPKTPRHDSF